jgi:hypothetical protein
MIRGSYQSLKGENMTFKCGNKPGKGHYESVETGEIITLDQDTDRLPPCPLDKKSCNWKKID